MGADHPCVVEQSFQLAGAASTVRLATAQADWAGFSARTASRWRTTSSAASGWGATRRWERSRQRATSRWRSPGLFRPVPRSLPTGPPGSPPATPESLVDLPVGAAVAAFLLLAAVDHLLTATVLRRTYDDDLRAGISPSRWVEYSVSATLMVILIALHTGTSGISALIGIAGANVAMILFGWQQESANPPGRSTVTMKPLWFGCVAGAAPWVAIAYNVVAAEQVPGFMMGVFVTLFVFFTSFALNQWLRYRQVGPWRSYAFGEKAYLVLSLVAKSARSPGRSSPARWRPEVRSGVAGPPRRATDRRPRLGGDQRVPVGPVVRQP